MNAEDKKANCKIGQPDRCITQGCSWKHVFGFTCLEKATFPNTVIRTKMSGKRKRLFDDAQGICYLCNKPIEFKTDATIDHVTPLSRGGKDCYENLKIAHRKCNGRKGNLLLSELILPFK
jgi:5-methylcytosine-specific restriction endonuclease McrA